MAIRILFDPILAFVLFMAGIWFSTINITFGLMAILGGLLFGFSSLRNDVRTMNKKSKVLFYGAFISFLLLFSIAFFIITEIVV